MFEDDPLPRPAHGSSDILELAFDSQSLRTLCESEACARRDLGQEVAEALKRRLADLNAATSVNDLVIGLPREVEGTDHQEMAVDLRDGYRIIFGANHPKNPIADNGDLNWARVSRLKILRIESNHV